MRTFGDFAENFLKVTFGYAKNFERVDLVFDRYRAHSIKSATRVKRKKGVVIRRVLAHRDVPLPHDWDGYLSDSNNKMELEDFISHEFIASAPDDVIAVTAGGLLEDEDVMCNKDVDVESIKSNHEEADTRMLLHACHTASDTVFVWCRDTDVLVLLIAHSHSINKSIVIKAGTSKTPQFIPIHDIVMKYNIPPHSAMSLLSFHAITGSDTTSYLVGHSKRTAFQVYLKHMELLDGLGMDSLTNESIQKCELFICRLYGTRVSTADEARVALFKKGLSQELLPPTSNALRFHIERSHLQSLIWQKALEAKPQIPPAVDYGWKLESDVLVPILMTSEPLPSACINLIRCGCKGSCTTQRCSCRKSKMPCTGLCKCDGNCLNHVS